MVRELVHLCLADMEAEADCDDITPRGAGGQHHRRGVDQDGPRNHEPPSGIRRLG